MNKLALLIIISNKIKKLMKKILKRHLNHQRIIDLMIILLVATGGCGLDRIIYCLPILKTSFGSDSGSFLLISLMGSDMNL